MCSVDVQSLFTNIPLHETIDYICGVVESRKLSIPIPTELLKDTILLCTENVRFNFLVSPYKQVDEVAVGSPLSPVLADFFMIMIKESMIHDIEKLHLYKRYVDDTFTCCESKSALYKFVARLNSRHANLNVTHEIEIDNSSSFLDISIARKENGTLSGAIYRKPTWTCRYTHFSSFTLKKHKCALVRTLFTRAHKICMFDMLEPELHKISQTLTENG